MQTGITRRFVYKIFAIFVITKIKKRFTNI
nr:MAG TPA: hypothetical protein [Caudoviricetes sp.]